MTIKKAIASKTLAQLDRIGLQVEVMAKEGKIGQKVASELLHNIDTFADRLHIAAYGQEAFIAYKQKVAKVIQRDPDETFMDTFENTQQPLQTDPDETFMHQVGPSFNSKAIKTFEQDPSSVVADRDEYAVRELNEFSDGTKKQPSWARGPAGKSTKNGSTVASVPEKEWAR